MNLSPFTAAAALAASSLLALGACQNDVTSTPTATGAQVEVVVAPLSLTGVGDASYAITVVNAGGEPVFAVTASSSRYGDGAGALTYVGPCDASANPNAVTVELLELFDLSGEPLEAGSWRQPGPVTRSVACREDADVAVDFDLTILRAANVGFFDIAVEFSDVFCSAKLDCVDAFLHNGGERDATVIVAVACTSGEGSPTWLHMDPVVVACDDGTQLTVNPGLPEGNQGGLAPYFFEAATYRGRQDLPGIDSCYWNTAVGVDEAALPAGLECTLTAAATAGTAAWPMGSTPAGAVYPFIAWEVPIVVDGALVCGQHAVDVAGSGVATTYTSGEQPRHFPFTMACGADVAVTSNGVVCGTSVGQGDAVEFISLGGGEVAVNVGGVQSEAMRLPEGLALASSCCQDHCCAP